MTTSVFLPDFVGYPLCYLGIGAGLPADAPALFVDYNDRWPYPSVAALVDRLAAELRGRAIGTIVGYSFGAHVAVLLAAALGDSPELVLIDPPPIATMPPRDPAAVEVLLRSRPEYAYVFDAIDAELTSLACVLGNVSLLAQIPPRRPLRGRGTLYVAGDADAAAAVLAELDGDHALDVVCLADRDHRSILQDPGVTARLTAIATRSSSA